MLKKTFVCSIFILGVFIFLFLTNMFFIKEKDLKEYTELTQRDNDFKTAHQKRQSVKKDLYIIDKNARKHFIISSDHSEIFLRKKHQKYELIENLSKIKFLCLENILKQSNIQNIKCFQAQTGTYFFPTHKLQLNDINLAFINTALNPSFLKNWNMQNAYFKGSAKELYFSISKKKPLIEAISFEGSFNPKKGLKCE